MTDHTPGSSRQTAPRRREEGVALVITLSLILLVTVAAVAFLSRATGGHAVETSRSGQVLVKQIAQTGADYTMSSFLKEIADNSTNDALLGVCFPTNTNAALNPTKLPPSAIYMVPQRALTNAISVEDTNFLNLVRSSVNVSTNGVGETNASAHGTADPSRNGRFVGTNRWNAPMLLSGDGFTNAAQLPRWIYVTKEGSIANTLTATNAANVIGRFAYCAYDIGGLLDANVAGYPSRIDTKSSKFRALKGTLAGADLSRLPGFSNNDGSADTGPDASGSPVISINDGSMDTFVRWRADSAYDYASTVMRYASNGYLQVSTNIPFHRFTSRQDLIRLARSGTNGLSLQALPYLTHFTRELARPMILTNGLWSMTRRYDLSQLASWITNAAAVASNGLSGSFPELIYAPTNSPFSTNIGTNPTLFQILQAGINFTNGLEWETKGPVSPPLGAFLIPTPNWPLDMNLKAVAIGANIIDQFADTTNPTRITYENTYGSYIVAGKKPLPYVSQIFLVYNLTPIPGSTPPMFNFNCSIIPQVSSQGDAQNISVSVSVGGITVNATPVPAPPITVACLAGTGISPVTQIPLAANPVPCGFFVSPLIPIPGPPTPVIVTINNLAIVLKSAANDYSAFGKPVQNVPLPATLSTTINIPITPATAISPAFDGASIQTQDPRTLRGAGLKMVGGVNNLAAPITPQSLPLYPNEITDTNIATPASRINSVGELGYVFRESPWRTIDFVSGPNSADRNLLDLFSAYPTPESGIRAGVVNLNTRQPAVLAALLSGTPINSSETGGIKPETATNIARMMTSMTMIATNEGSTSAPWTNRSQLVDLAYNCSTNNALLGSDKQSVESVVRALGEVGQVRTWNLLLDVVAQSGTFPRTKVGTGEFSAKEFTVSGEKRQWISVAIDRFTGQVIDRQTEEVSE